MLSLFVLSLSCKKPIQNSKTSTIEGANKASISEEYDFFKKDSVFFLSNLMNTKSPVEIRRSLQYFTIFPLDYGTLRSSGLSSALERIIALGQYNDSVARVLGMYCPPQPQCETFGLISQIVGSLEPELGKWLEDRSSGKASYYSGNKPSSISYLTPNNSPWDQSTLVRMGLDDSFYQNANRKSAMSWYKTILNDFPSTWNPKMGVIDLLGKIVLINQFARKILEISDENKVVSWPMIFEPIVEKVYPVFWQIYDYLEVNKDKFKDLQKAMSYPCDRSLCPILDYPEVRGLLLEGLMGVKINFNLKKLIYSKSVSPQVYFKRWAELLEEATCVNSEKDPCNRQHRFMEVALLASRKSNSVNIPPNPSNVNLYSLDNFYKLHYETIKLIDKYDLGRCNFGEFVKFNRHCPLLGVYLTASLSPLISAYADSNISKPGNIKSLGIADIISTSEHAITIIKHPKGKDFAASTIKHIGLYLATPIEYENAFFSTETTVTMAGNVACDQFTRIQKENGSHFKGEHLARTAYMMTRMYHVLKIFGDNKNIDEFHEDLNTDSEYFECHENYKLDIVSLDDLHIHMKGLFKYVAPRKFDDIRKHMLEGTADDIRKRTLAYFRLGDET